MTKYGLALPLAPSSRLAVPSFADSFTLNPGTAAGRPIEIGGVNWQVGNLNDTGGPIFTIGGGQAFYSGPGVSDCHMYVETGQTDGVVEVDLQFPSGSNAGVLVRRLDSANYYACRINNLGASQLTIFRNLAGVRGTILSKTLTIDGTQTYRISAWAFGNNIFFYLNGVLVLEFFGTAATALPTATKHGLYTNVDPNQRFDNWAFSRTGTRAVSGARSAA